MLAAPLQLLRASQCGDRRHQSWVPLDSFFERAFACAMPSSPLAVLGMRALESCESALERLEALTALRLSSHLGKDDYAAARDELWRNVSTGELECTVVVGAVTHALAHAAALEPRDFARENAMLGAERLLSLLRLSLGANSRFDAQNTMLQEVVQRQLRELRELPDAEALMAQMDELVQTPRTDEFESESAAWLDAQAQLERLHRRPFGAYSDGPSTCGPSLPVIALALHGIGRAALASKAIRRGATEPDEALAALAARLLKLVYEALRRHGSMLYKLAQPELAADAWKLKQKAITKMIMDEKAGTAADARAFAQLNLESPDKWHENARYTYHRTSRSHRPLPPPPAHPASLGSPRPQTRRARFRPWQSFIVWELITLAPFPHRMKPLSRKCWEHVRPEVKESLVTSCWQLMDAYDQVSSRTARTLTRALAFFCSCHPDPPRVRQMQEDAEDLQGATEQFYGQVIACELALNRNFEYGGVKLVRRAAAAPPASASLAPPRRCRHLLVLTR